MMLDADQGQWVLLLHRVAGSTCEKTHAESAFGKHLQMEREGVLIAQGLQAIATPFHLTEDTHGADMTFLRMAEFGTAQAQQPPRQSACIIGSAVQP